MSEKQCPTHSNLLWYVAGVLKDESLKQSITDHLNKCPHCTNTHKAMLAWAEEDRKVYEEVMQAPWSEIPTMLDSADTSLKPYHAPIVERCIQEIRTGTPNNKDALDLLLRIAKTGPLIPRKQAEQFLFDI
jgi:hypothetical protein